MYNTVDRCYEADAPSSTAAASTSTAAVPAASTPSLILTTIVSAVTTTTAVWPPGGGDEKRTTEAPSSCVCDGQVKSSSMLNGGYCVLSGYLVLVLSLLLVVL